MFISYLHAQSGTSVANVEISLDRSKIYEIELRRRRFVIPAEPSMNVYIIPDFDEARNLLVVC